MMTLLPLLLSLAIVGLPSASGYSLRHSEKCERVADQTRRQCNIENATTTFVCANYEDTNPDSKGYFTFHRYEKDTGDQCWYLSKEKLAWVDARQACHSLRLKYLCNRPTGHFGRQRARGRLANFCNIQQLQVAHRLVTHIDGDVNVKVLSGTYQYPKTTTYQANWRWFFTNYKTPMNLFKNGTPKDDSGGMDERCGAFDAWGMVSHDCNEPEHYLCVIDSCENCNFAF